MGFLLPVNCPSSLTSYEFTRRSQSIAAAAAAERNAQQSFWQGFARLKRFSRSFSLLDSLRSVWVRGGA